MIYTLNATSYDIIRASIVTVNLYDPITPIYDCCTENS